MSLILSISIVIEFQGHSPKHSCETFFYSQIFNQIFKRQDKSFLGSEHWSTDLWRWRCDWRGWSREGSRHPTCRQRWVWAPSPEPGCRFGLRTYARQRPEPLSKSRGQCVRPLACTTLTTPASQHKPSRHDWFWEPSWEEHGCQTAQWGIQNQKTLVKLENLELWHTG